MLHFLTVCNTLNLQTRYNKNRINKGFSRLCNGCNGCNGSF
nr:MAG TPA: hypothetical protein [Caudoviricetes sp.]